MKLSFEELNTMSLQDFADFMQMWADDGDPDAPRKATQADIDGLLR